MDLLVKEETELLDFIIEHDVATYFKDLQGKENKELILLGKLCKTIIIQ